MKIYPNSLELGRCKLCHAPIAWLLTFPNQRKVPLDLPLQSHELEFDAQGHQVETLLSPTYFDTCPNYRKPTAPAKPLLQGSLFEEE